MRTRTMRKLRRTAALALLAVPATVWADSGVGVDTWLANKLDPSGGQATKPLDPDGTSWLEPGQQRSPAGNLNGTPTEEPHPETLSVWQIYGTFDVGYLHATGTKTALYDRYTRWLTNGPAFDFDVNAERPSDGSYAEARGSRISAERVPLPVDGQGSCGITLMHAETVESQQSNVIDGCERPFCRSEPKPSECRESVSWYAAALQIQKSESIHRFGMA